MLNVTLFTKKDCKLCDEVKAYLEELQSKFPHRLAEVDIETDVSLREKYGLVIPVVEVGPYTLEAPISKERLQVVLGAASDRKNQLEKLEDPVYKYRTQKGRTLSTGDRVSFWIAKRYLLLLNLFFLLYAGLPFLAPTLMELGATVPAQIIYRIYKPLCHQFGFRSFFLFGEQPFYPLAEAGMTNYKTFEEVTGIKNLSDPYSLTRFDARNYIGDSVVGYKVAICERDAGIYIAILLFGIIYGFTGRRMKSLHWIGWILIGIAPIGLDGFSQLFSQFNWPWLASILPYRESTPYLRLLTGMLFGFATAWFAYPNIEESMKETREYFLKKFAVIQASD